MKGLTDVPGILAGHATDPDALTGRTVINADILGAESMGLRAILVRSEDPRAPRCAESLRDVKKFLRSGAEIGCPPFDAPRDS